MNIRIYHSCFLALFFCFSLHGSAQFNQGLLWRVSHGQQTVGYVYGSIHLPDPEFTSYGSEVEQAFNKCSAVYGELNLMDMSQQFEMLKQLTMENTSLQDLFTKEEFETVDKILSTQLPKQFQFFKNSIKPFFLIAQLQSGDGDPSAIVDFHFQLKAKDTGKEVGGLETFEEQMDVINKMDYTSQAKMLYQICQHFEAMSEEITKLKAMYIAQDIHAMIDRDQFAAAGFSDEMEKALLDQRNQVMAARMAQLFKTKKTFVVIGAAHLDGSNGVLQQLLNQGYTVDKVNFEFK